MTRWALMELRRAPFEPLLLAAALCSLTVLLGLSLLLPLGTERALRRQVEASPSLVLRGRTAIERPLLPELAELAGVTQVQGRVWTTNSEPSLLLVGLEVPIAGVSLGREQPLSIVPSLERGQALARPGSARPGDRFVGPRGLSFEVVGLIDTLPGPQEEPSRVLLLHPDDVRAMTGLQQDQLVDVAIETRHAAEERALRDEILALHAGSLTILTRGEARGELTARLSQRGTLGVIAVLPAILATLLLMIQGARRSRGIKVGLCRVFGWSQADLLRLALTRDLLLVALPAMAVGLVITLSLLSFAGAGIADAWLGASGSPPPELGLSELLVGVVELGAILLVPLTAGIVWGSLRASIEDPLDLVEGGES